MNQAVNLITMMLPLYGASVRLYLKQTKASAYNKKTTATSGRFYYCESKRTLELNTVNSEERIEKSEK